MQGADPHQYLAQGHFNMQSRVTEPATFLSQDAGSAPEPQPSDSDHVVTMLFVESLCHEVNVCVM